MDRLTKMGKNGKIYCIHKGINYCGNIYTKELAFDYITNEERLNILKKLVDYEEAEEQGLLVKLPCKIGDYVYKVIDQRDNFDDTLYKIISCVNFKYEMIGEIGKTVFLTRKQAEQSIIGMTKC